MERHIDLARVPQLLKGANVFIGEHEPRWIEAEHRHSAVPAQLPALIRAMGGRVSKSIRVDGPRAQRTTHVLYQEFAAGADVGFGVFGALEAIERLDPGISTESTSILWRKSRALMLEPSSKESARSGQQPPPRLVTDSARNFYVLCRQACTEKERRRDGIAELLQATAAPQSFVGI